MCMTYYTELSQNIQITNPLRPHLTRRDQNRCVSCLMRIAAVWINWEPHPFLCCTIKLFRPHTVSLTDYHFSSVWLFAALFPFLAFPLYNAITHPASQQKKILISDPAQLLSPSLLTMSLLNLITSAPRLFIRLVSSFCPSRWLTELCHGQIPSQLQAFFCRPGVSNHVPCTTQSSGFHQFPPPLWITLVCKLWHELGVMFTCPENQRNSTKYVVCSCPLQWRFHSCF